MNFSVKICSSAFLTSYFNEFYSKYIAVLILGSISFASGSQCSEILNGYNVSPGSNDLIDFADSNLGHCCERCQFYTYCKAFVFNSLTHHCYLKTSDSPRSLDGNPGVISGLPTPQIAVDLYSTTILPDFDIPGNDLVLITPDSNTPVIFVSTCCRFCNQRNDCDGFTYVDGGAKSYQLCFLKKLNGTWPGSPPAPQLVRYSSQFDQATSGLKQRPCSNIVNGWDITPGQFDLPLSFYTDSKESCCDSCNGNPKCSGWVWKSDEAKCFLKSGNGNRIQRDSRYWSGFRGDVTSSTVDAGPPNNHDVKCSGVLSGYDTSPGSNDMAQFGGLTLENCCAKCQSFSGCAAWVFNSLTANCYLKSVSSPRILSPTSGLITGLPDFPTTSGVDGSCQGVTRGFDISPRANDLPDIVYAVDLDGCCSLCNSKTACTGYVWEENSSGACHLKTGAGNWFKSGRTDLISGLKNNCPSIQNGFDISPGSNDIGMASNVRTIEACCVICNANPSCASWVWKSDLHLCFVKSVSGPSVSRGTNFWSGLRGPFLSAVTPDTVPLSPPPSPAKCTNLMSGFDISPGSNDIHDYSGATLNCCCFYCQMTKGCVAFVFDINSNRCFLKSATGPRVQSSANLKSGLTSLPSTTSSCPEVLQGYDYGTWLDNLNFVNYMATVGDCCEFCNINYRDTVAFVWDETSTQCWCKKAANFIKAGNNLISGLRRSCREIEYGMDISPGLNDIGKSTTSSWIDCCNGCFIIPNCSGWVWKSSTLECFLKSGDGAKVAASSDLISGFRGLERLDPGTTCSAAL